MIETNSSLFTLIAWGGIYTKRSTWSFVKNRELLNLTIPKFKYLYLIDVIFPLKNEFSFFMYILRCFPDISSFSLNVFTLILVIYIVNLCSLNFSNFNCLQCFLWINAAYVGVLKSFCSFIRDCQIGNFTLNQIWKFISVILQKPKCCLWWVPNQNICIGKSITLFKGGILILHQSMGTDRVKILV